MATTLRDPKRLVCATCPHGKELHRDRQLVPLPRDGVRPHIIRCCTKCDCVRCVDCDPLPENGYRLL